MVAWLKEPIPCICFESSIEFIISYQNINFNLSYSLGMNNSRENLHGRLEKQLRNSFNPNHFWSPSDWVVSVGGASLEVLKQSIENQRKPVSEKQINPSKKISAKSRGLAQALGSK
jgi:hypothetical protein